MQPPPGFHTHRCPRCGHVWKHQTECAMASERARTEMHTCPGCGEFVTVVDRVLGTALSKLRQAAGRRPNVGAAPSWGPPPPTFYDYERPRPASVSSGPGLGFYIKTALFVGGIFGVAAIAQSVADTSREIRKTIRG